MSDLAPTAAARNLAACHLCFKLAPAALHRCPRCHSALHMRKPDSIQRTLALLVTACILYIPANLYPIMITDQLGTSEPSTILGGVILLMVILGVVLRFVQESRADTAAASLRAMISVKATVLRDGKPQEEPIAHLVPGDVVVGHVRQGG